MARELLLHSELVRKAFLREGAEKNFEISEILQRYLSLKIPVVQLSSQIYSSISPVDTSAGIICEIRIPEDGNIKKTKIGFILTVSKIPAMSEPFFVLHWLRA